MGIRAANFSLGLHVNSAGNARPTQVYHHTYSDGSGNFKTYTGVGDVEGKRSWKSLNKYNGKDGFTYYDSKYTNVSNRAKAYKLEQIIIDTRGGAKSAENPDSQALQARFHMLILN